MSPSRSDMFVPEKPPPAVQAIASVIVDLLPPVQARIRRERIVPLARRIAALTDPRDFASEEKRGLLLATLATLTIRAVGKMQMELAELDRRVAGHVEAYARAKTDEARQVRLELMIEETAPDARSARADRRALERHLDLDALRERYDLMREEIAIAIELGIMVVGPAIDNSLQVEDLDLSSSFVVRPAVGIHSEVRTVLNQVEPVSFLIDQLVMIRRWPARLACLESLERVLASLGMPVVIGGHRRESPARTVADLRSSLIAIAEDRSDHEWVQARAVACLRHVDAEDARACVRRRLGLDSTEPVDWPTRDFLVRGLIIDQLGARLDDAGDAALLEESIERGDPSEFVTIAQAKTLAGLATARPESFDRFARALTRTEAEGAEGVELPRVRATACLALPQALAAAIDMPQGPRVAEIAVERIAMTIVSAPEGLVGRVACEQAPKLCLVIAGSPILADHVEDHAATLLGALHACLGDEARHASIHEAASVAIEGIDEALRYERGVWTAKLEQAAASVPSGGQRRVRLPSHEGARPSEDELARILPMLTRNDWGLDVDRRGDSLVIRRGDHRVTRMWRVLHEIRHPSGNKRQAFRHTTGRRYVGALRAHAGRLDEVTATVVPGERLHLDAEGGWGRHLPLVDDVLGLSWLRGERAGPVTIASSHGVTRVRLRGGLARRLRARWRLNFRYAELAELRRRALIAKEPSERRRFAEVLREQYGVELEFAAHPSPIGERPIPGRVRALFSRPTKAEAAPAQTGEGAGASASASAMVPAGLAGPLSGQVPGVGPAVEWVRDHLHYFLTLEGNSQEALGLYALGLSSLFIGSGYFRRRKIARARAAIPLSVGGWGTRGKSGTERLKAGLFHGLGFRTFSKTTGCEAMFIHAAPLGPQVEIFTFRPYGKATIWEQRNLLVLAAGLGSEVFLWECMALNPEYVDILQRGWMRDDMATITNTYPDHEDIQGPAGIDVATVIGRFVPQGNLVISSELAFNPILRDSAASRDAEIIEIGDYEGDLLPDDLLGLFPYSEHPRNIALVTELARQLGIDDELAIVCMADYVYPDLGVLKIYPDVQIRGRTLSFINGHSANERAGFLNNWRRTTCDEVAAAGDPAHMVMLVVNNRDDRISRSEVFSRIIVNDVDVDAHVLIGTNLAGLQIFIDRALEAYLSEQELVDAEALASGDAGIERARTRLRALLARVRAPVDGWKPQLATLMRLGLATLGRRLDPDSAEVAALYEHVEGLRREDGSHDYETVVAKLASDKALNSMIRAVHDKAAEAPELVHPHEVGRDADYDDYLSHLRQRIARMVIAGRFAVALEPILARRDAAGLANFTKGLTESWATMFRGLVVVVHDAGATGDQVIDATARAVPPGVRVSVMGSQNIKGTGLDFIYRWLSLDAVVLGLAKLDSDDEQTRLDALRALDAHSDFGFMDTGTLVKRLPEYTQGSGQEASLRRALRDKAAKIHQEKLGKLDSSASGAAAKGGKFWTWIEGWIDFMDGAVRYRQSQQLVQDLIDYRVSHNKMAVEMREIYARAKGGWLGKALAAKLALRDKQKQTEA